MCNDISGVRPEYSELEKLCWENPRTYSLLQNFVDGEVGMEDAESIQRHLKMCKKCNARFKELVQLKGDKKLDMFLEEVNKA